MNNEDSADTEENADEEIWKKRRKIGKKRRKIRKKKRKIRKALISNKRES